MIDSILAFLLFLFMLCVCFSIFKESELLGKVASGGMFLVFLVIILQVVFPNSFLNTPYELTDQNKATLLEICKCDNCSSYEAEVEQFKIILICMDDDGTKRTPSKFGIGELGILERNVESWC